MAVKTKTSAGRETVSQTVARAKSMLGSNYNSKTKAPTQARVDEIANQKFVSSSVRDAYNKSKTPVITPERVAPTEVAEVPTAPTQPNIGDVVGANNTGIATMLSGLGYTQDTNGLFVAPKEAAGTSSDLSGQANAFQNYISAAIGNTPVNQEAIYNKSLRESGVNEAQRDVNKYTSQLNAIVAKSQAEQLGLEGQGRGITESIIGGQQAQINREAAIQALPIQAQLSAAQGNLEFAQKQLDTMFQLRVADANAKYNFKSNLISSVYNFATTLKQSRLNGLKAKEDRAFAVEQQNLAMAQEWAKMAVSTGQSGLITAFTSLDTKSPTFMQDLGKLQAQVREPVSTSAAKPTLQNFGTSDAPIWKQYNSATGGWDDVDGLTAAAATGAGGQSLVNLNSKYTELIKDIGDAKKLAENGAVGAGMIERGFKSLFSSNTNFNQVENIADTIKSNLLTLNTDPAIKKFFGPQMSNRDTELMTGAASTLNPAKQTPEQFTRDLQDAAAVIARAREAVRQGLGLQAPAPFQSNPNALPPSVSERFIPNIVTAPDGLQIEIID